MSTPPEFPAGTPFRAAATITNESETAGVVEVTFTVADTIYAYADYPQVTPQELADHISDLYQSRGWPELKFKGRPEEVPVN